MKEKYGPNKLRGPCSVQYNDVQDSGSFKAMRSPAQLLVMKAKRFYNRTTQGPVPMSARIAAKLVKTSKDMGLSLMNEAIHYGLWRKHTAGHLGVNGKGVATFVQLTDEMFQGKPATLDFLKWDGTPFHEQKSPAYYTRRERSLARLKAFKTRGKNNHKKTEPRPVCKDTPVLCVEDTPVPDTQDTSPKTQQNPVPDTQDISKNALHLAASPLGSEPAEPKPVLPWSTPVIEEVFGDERDATLREYDDDSIPAFLRRGHPDCYVKE
jgi:hypothetical protein